MKVALKYKNGTTTNTKSVKIQLLQYAKATENKVLLNINLSLNKLCLAI